MLNKLIALCIAAALTTSLSSAAQQTLPELGDVTRGDLSPRAEQSLGKAMIGAISKDPDYLDDNSTTTYLNGLVTRLLANHPERRGELQYPFEVFLVRDKSLNAFALPGGYIGIHTGLVAATETESELAAVLAHEISHVSQRHIARMLMAQKQDVYIPFVTMGLALLTSRTNTEVSKALVFSGQGVALQRQINFSQEAEREADRMGHQLLVDADFDPRGMSSFFEKLEKSTTLYSDAKPVFLKSHPLTSERLAEANTRTESLRYSQKISSLDYLLFKAKTRVSTATTFSELTQLQQSFERALSSLYPPKKASAQFGLSLLFREQSRYVKSREFLSSKPQDLPDVDFKQNLFFTEAQVDTELRAKALSRAVALAEEYARRVPPSESSALLYASTMLKANLPEKVTVYLGGMNTLPQPSLRIQKIRAEAYSSQDKPTLQHLAMADYYELQQQYGLALDELARATISKDVPSIEGEVIVAKRHSLQILLDDSKP